jgi:hypothetical protein
MARAANIPIMPFLEGREGKLREMRFWSKVRMLDPGECWDWQASLNHHGYGRFKIAGNVTLHANRVAWALFNKTDPDEMMVLHDCDRPRCCNPHHLRIGTPLDNINDMDERGRRVTVNQSGSANGAAKINDAVLATIVRRLNGGWSNKQIAADLPVGHALVSRIRVGLSWKRQSAALGWMPRAQFQRKAASSPAVEIERLRGEG